ncbi:hypothetical protein GCM10009605_07720 [Nocardiopsis composta]
MPGARGPRAGHQGMPSPGRSTPCRRTPRRPRAAEVLPECGPRDGRRVCIRSPPRRLRTAPRIWHPFSHPGADDFPLFIPESYLRREAEHIEGFAPELAPGR